MQNSPLKEIKIFIASSKELADDRESLVALMASLNNYYSRKGIYIRVYIWEDEDSKLNGRKQDEYNENIKDSDIFLCLFWTIAGEYTVEEFKVANGMYESTKSPVIYVYMKDNSTLKEDVSLTQFKDELERVFGHFPGQYTYIDSLKFDFLSKWIKFNPVIDYTAITVRNETIYIEDRPADIRVTEIDFVRNNEEFASIMERIKKAEIMLAKYPEEEYFINELKSLKNQRADLEKGLVSTALTIARLDNQESSKRLKQATTLFHEGNYKGAMAILDTELIQDEIKDNISKLKWIESIKNEYQQALKNRVDELMLKASLIVNQLNPVNLGEADNIYTYILSLLDKLDEETQQEILYSISIYYSESFDYVRSSKLLLKLLNYRLDDRRRILTLSQLGEAYCRLNIYDKAFRCFFDAVTIWENDEYRTLSDDESRSMLLSLTYITQFVELKEDDDRKEFQNFEEMVMSISNQRYGSEITEENAIFHLYHALSLIRLGNKNNAGLSKIHEIRHVLESKESNYCKLQLVQLYRVLAQHIHNSRADFLEGYEYAVKSLSLLQKMTDEDDLSLTDTYLDSIKTVILYEFKKGNNRAVIDLVKESLTRLSLFPEERLLSFSSQIISLLSDAAGAQLELRTGDSVDMSWSEPYLKIILRVIERIQSQSDKHNHFCSEYVLLSLIVSQINFDGREELKLAFDKLLIDIIYDELKSHDDNINVITSFIIIGSIADFGQHLIALSEYARAFEYFKKGLFIMEVMQSHDNLQPKQILPKFKVGIVNTFLGLGIDDPQIESDSYDMLMDADRCFQKIGLKTEEDIDSYTQNCNNLALLSLKLGDTNYSLDLIRRALSLRPDDVNILDTLGEICISIDPSDSRISMIVEKIKSIDSTYFENNDTVFTTWVKAHK